MSQVSNDCLVIIMLFILFILFLHDSHRLTREIKKASSKRAHQSLYPSYLTVSNSFDELVKVFMHY
jgi:hypothetical protein